MNEKQFENFIYCCQRMANQLHFNNVDGVVYYLSNKGLKDQTFSEVVSENNQLVKSLSSGVCFTMSCWVFELLFSMGLKNGYYLMESLNAHWPNTVILYNSPNGYRICDLAAQTIKNENTIAELTSIARDYKKGNCYYKTDEILDTLTKLSDSQYLTMTIEDYVKQYPIDLCKVLMHHGCEDMIYTEVPRKSLTEFILEQQQSNNINSKKL